MYNEEQEKRFVEKVAEYNWSSVDSYSTFHNALQEIIDETFSEILSLEDKENVEIANKFNDYYVTIGKNKQKSVNKRADVEQPALNPLHLVRDQTPVQPFDFFKPIDEHTLKRIIEALKINPELSPDAYGFSVRLLKSIADIISGTLVDLINKSFEEDVFPAELKLAAVIPHSTMPNADYDHDDPSNFRPVSIVSPLSRVFEYVIVRQLREYFEKNHMFSEKQHAFTKGRNLHSAVLLMLNVTFAEIKKERSVKYTMYDLSEAYDSVDHEILLNKLKWFGIGHKALKYIESYLKGRSQFVRRCGSCSDIKDINVGIPQGVKLAPFLFAAYINDLPDNMSESLCTLLYADDVYFITPFQENDVKMEEKINEDVDMWLRSNLLQVDENKIQRLLIPYKKPNKIESINCLHLTLCNDLSWSGHINYLVENKLPKAIKSIEDMIAVGLPYKEIRSTYLDNFFLPLVHNILLWGHEEEANVIFERQKEVISMLMPGRESMQSKFRSCSLLTLPSLYIRTCLRLAHELSSHGNWDLEIYRTQPKYTLEDLYNAVPEPIKKFGQIKFYYRITEVLIEGAFFSIEEFINFPKNSKLYYGFTR